MEVLEITQVKPERWMCEHHRCRSKATWIVHYGGPDELSWSISGFCDEHLPREAFCLWGMKQFGGSP